MPINTRSMRKVTQPSPAKSATMKTGIVRTISAKPPTGSRVRSKKTTDDYVPLSSKSKEKIPGTRVNNPGEFAGHRSVAAALKMEINKPAQQMSSEQEKPLNFQAEFENLANFFGSAISKSQEFYNIFKEAQEEFNCNLQLSKQLLETRERDSFAKVPMYQTPLGKQMYSKLFPSSVLRNAEAPKPNKRMRSPEDNSEVSRPIDQLPKTFEFGIKSPMQKKVIIETLVEENATAPSNVTYVQNVMEKSEDKSVDLFPDEDLEGCDLSVPKVSPLQIIPQNERRVEDSSSSSVSALVERFELKKAKKLSNNFTVPSNLEKHQESIFSKQEPTPMESEPCAESDNINGTFIFESSVVESPCNTQTIATVEPATVNQCASQKDVMRAANATFTKIVAYKMASNSNDQTFLVNKKINNETTKLSIIMDSESEDESAPSVSNKTYVTVKDVERQTEKKTSNTQGDKLSKAHSSSKSTCSTKSGVSSLSSSSSGSMKSALSQPSLTSIPPYTKMGLKNTVLTGSAGTVFEKQKLVKEKESDIKKRLIEKEEEAMKRKLELDQRKMELQKKKNEEWKRKAEKMKAEEKKFPHVTVPLKVPCKGVTGINLNANANNFKVGKVPMPNMLKGPTNGFFPSKYNPKFMLPPNNPPPKMLDEPSRDDSYRTAFDGCSFLDVTDVDPANNYDITKYEDIDEECKHRENKSIPEWAQGKNITLALLKQIPYENADLHFFPRVDPKYKLFPNL